MNSRDIILLLLYGQISHICAYHINYKLDLYENFNIIVLGKRTTYMEWWKIMLGCEEKVH